jgi:truncated hemoglobin YjbI
MYLDREAIEDLVKQLSFLKAKGDHARFFTPSWGGNPLTEQKYGKQPTLSHHLRITLVAE